MFGELIDTSDQYIELSLSSEITNALSFLTDIAFWRCKFLDMSIKKLKSTRNAKIEVSHVWISSVSLQNENSNVPNAMSDFVTIGTN